MQLKTLALRSTDEVEPALADALAERAATMLVFTGATLIIDRFRGGDSG